MSQDLVQLQPVVRADPQARLHQVLALHRHLLPEVDLGVADVLVLFEGYVSAHHVVEEDAEGPDGERVGGVTSETDPLRRGVNAGPVKVGVVRFFEESS